MKGGVKGSALTVRTATRANPGMASRKTSRRLPPSSASMLDSPVTFPPGRARLSTSPSSSGAPAGAISLGSLLVAILPALTAGV